MADLVDSQTALLVAVAVIIIAWLLSFPGGKREKKSPWDFHF